MGVVLGGKKRELKYSVNAVRELIKATGKTPAELLGGGLDPTDLETGVKLIWGGLLHENPKLKPETVGDWLDAAEGVYAEALTEAAAALMRTFEKQFNTTVATGDEEDAKN